jgi:long-chain acyl-CoA synthetase
MVTGEAQKFASALILPNFAYISDWFASMNRSLPDPETLIRDQEVIKAIGEEVKRINRRLNEPERVIRFKLVANEWSPATGELSPSLKLRRHFIAEKYSSELNEIYSMPAG